VICRVGLAAALALVAVGGAAGPASSAAPIGSGVYTVRVDPRLCPSPLCGGYWVAFANGARTTCADGRRRPRCYVAKAVDEERHPLEVAVPDLGLARADLESWDFEGVGRLGVLAVTVVFTPAGSAPVSGGYYRVVDTGVRCVRTPCFSFRVTQVNGSTRTTTSGVDLRASGALAGEIARAQAALHTKNGLIAQGRFARTPDGGRLFRATRLYLRAPQPRA
jgi:hypothetical protein